MLTLSEIDEFINYEVFCFTVYQDDLEPVGNADCGGCGRTGDLYPTPNGLRCVECRSSENARVSEQSTYSPSYRFRVPASLSRVTDDMSSVVYDYVESGLRIEMFDGTMFELDKFQFNTLLAKGGEDYWKEYVAHFASDTAECFENGLEPAHFGLTEFGESASEHSQEDYDSHAELAPVVGQNHLVSFTAQLALPENSGTTVKTPTIVGLGDSLVLAETTEWTYITAEEHDNE